jgi:hypothetical protein
MRTRSRLVSAAALTILALTGATSAQVRTGEESGSLSALVAEVRQLRVAVEESNRRQAEIQTLSVYLSAQQSRLIQIGARLDAVRNELTAAAGMSQQFAGLLTNARSEAAQAGDADARHQAMEMTRLFKPRAADAAERERQIRERESELSQALHARKRGGRNSSRGSSSRSSDDRAPRLGVRTDPGYSVRRSLSVEEGVGDRDRERALCELPEGLNVSYRLTATTAFPRAIG